VAVPDSAKRGIGGVAMRVSIAAVVALGAVVPLSACADPASDYRLRELTTEIGDRHRF
jgi:hypothetical protein